MISVIMPIYNTAEYLSKSIESVIKQSNTDWELILVNDGSTDNSELICQDYAEKYDNISYHAQSNQGVSVARNLGLKMAQGEYVAFIDSDDVIDETYIEKIKKELNKKDIDLLFFNISLMDECGDFISEEPLTIGDYITSTCDERYSFLKEHFFKHELFFSPCNKVYKRKLILDNRIEFPKSVPIGEDMLFNVMYLLHVTAIKGISDSLYYYIQHESSAMHRMNKLYIEEYTKALKQLVDRRKFHNLSKSAFRDIFMQAIYDQYGKRMNNEHLHEYVRKVSDKLFLWNNTIYFVLRPWKLKKLYGDNKWLDMWKLLILVSSYCIA